jgi:hypothetical protein
MYTDVLRSIAGIEVFPVLSLVLFVTFFTAVLVWTVRMDRVRVDRLAALPLEDDSTAKSTGAGDAPAGPEGPAPHRG